MKKNFLLGFKRNTRDTGWNKTKKPKQYLSCMMLLVNADGERYTNILTGKPVGFKMIKKCGFVSSALHRNPGFFRPKFYYHGTKSMSESFLI